MLAALRSAVCCNTLVEGILFHHAPVTDLLVDELVKVETDHLGLLANTEVHEGNVLQTVKQDAGDDERVRGNRQNLGDLAADLDTHAVHGARVFRA